MADIVKDLYDKNLKQDKVLFQQKKPILNYEINLAQDILKNRNIDLAYLGLGNNFSGDAFKVYEASTPNEIKITKGTFYHLGRPIQITQDITVTGLTTPFTGDRTDTVFVEWYVEEIDATKDPSIVESGIGFETARQERLNVTVKVTENSTTPNPTSGRNYFTLAKLNRLNSVPNITTSMIEDERDRTVYNFVIEGCGISDAGGLNFDIGEGDVFVGDVEYYVESTTPQGTASGSSTGYSYVDSNGVVMYDTSLPTDYHVPLAKIITDSTSITEIEDLRKFRPIAWDYKYGTSGEGETGFPSIVMKYEAGENISKYEVVYISGDEIVSKAAASDINKLPAIGIAPQSFSSGQKDNIVVYGEISNSAWSWTAGDNLFLDTTSGQITNTAPTTANTFVHRIGIAISSDTIFINPDVTYIKNKVAETNFLVLRSDGSIEVMDVTDYIDPSRLLNLLCSAQDTPNRTFDISEGFYYIDDTDGFEYAGTTINMGPGQAYETTAISSGFYNKALFTIDHNGAIEMYEGKAASSLSSVNDPEIPDNELPFVLVNFKDDGSASAGTIMPITQDDLIDKRNWLNLGNLDGVSFKPVFRNEGQYIVHRGGAWFNNSLVTMSGNLLLNGTTVSDTTYYIYMDLIDATGGVSSSSFTTMTDSPNQVDRRRYIPLGQYDVSGGEIQRTSFVAYSSKYWQFRDSPYEKLERFVAPLAGLTSLTTTAFSFLDSDYLEMDINGVVAHEGDDYTKTAPNSINFNYTVKKNAKITIKKV